MNRYVKQAIIFLALLLIVTVVRLPYDTYPDSIRTMLQEAAAREQVSLAIDDLALNFPATLTSRGVRLAYPLKGTPLILPFVVDSLELSLQTLSLLALRYSTDLNVSLYDGKVEGTLSAPMFGNGVALRGEIQHIDLGKHPLAQAFGVSGMLTAAFELTGQRRDPRPPSTESGTITLSIVDGHYQGGHRISLLELPEIRDIGFTAKAEVEPRKFKLTRAMLSTSLGKARLNGSGARSESGLVTEGQAKITLNLSEDGRKRYAGFLALAAKMPLDRGEKISDWEVDLSFQGNRPPTVLVTATESS